jgi:hypothetical protein
VRHDWPTQGRARRGDANGGGGAGLWLRLREGQTGQAREGG